MKTTTENFLFAKIGVLLCKVKVLKRELKAWRNEAVKECDRANDTLRRLTEVREDTAAQIDELTSRITEMAPHKQFRVLLRNKGLTYALPITSVAHLNGETVITCAQAESL